MSESAAELNTPHPRHPPVTAPPPPSPHTHTQSHPPLIIIAPVFFLFPMFICNENVLYRVYYAMECGFGGGYSDITVI